MATATNDPRIISTVPELKAFISLITPSCTLYLDFEGYNLSRHGTLSLITVLVHPHAHVALIDVLTLQNETFTTAADNGKTLKAIFEDAHVSKCFWDVRNDADALWAHYKVGLAGVTDVQLLENASSDGRKSFLRGLSRCVQTDLNLADEDDEWLKTKELVKGLMDNDIFSVRPLEAKIIDYCINDVLHLPDLHDIYLNRLQMQYPGWIKKVADETNCRVRLSRCANYNPQSRANARGPWWLGKRYPTAAWTMVYGSVKKEDNWGEDAAGDYIGW